MTAGELAEHFEVSKPTMSAHFAVLREAGLVEPVKEGRVITYHLMMSVLEDAMFGFAQVFGLEVKSSDPSSSDSTASTHTTPTEESPT
jgi:ArsR family transcriptional regulator, repressor of sdpIR and other operons